MRYALLILPLIFAGCSGKRYTDVAEYERTHPHAKCVETAYAFDGDVPVMTKATFVDEVPTMTTGGSYRTFTRTDTFILRGGKVVDFVRKDGF